LAEPFGPVRKKDPSRTMKAHPVLSAARSKSGEKGWTRTGAWKTLSDDLAEGDAMSWAKKRDRI